MFIHILIPQVASSFYILLPSRLLRPLSFLFTLPLSDTIYLSLLFNNYSDTELIVTLWGSDATAFSVDHLYEETSPKVIVVLFLGCVAKNMFSKFPLKPKLLPLSLYLSLITLCYFI